MLYAFFDGDNIGNTIEMLLLEDKVKDAVSLSESLSNANEVVRTILATKTGVEIIILGGDDLLIKYDPQKQDRTLLEEIRNLYKSSTGVSLSCGVGESLSESIQNLHLAKLYGKDQIKGVR